MQCHTGKSLKLNFNILFESIIGAPRMTFVSLWRKIPPRSSRCPARSSLSASLPSASRGRVLRDRLSTSSNSQIRSRHDDKRWRRAASNLTLTGQSFRPEPASGQWRAAGSRELWPRLFQSQMDFLKSRRGGRDSCFLEEMCRAARRSLRGKSSVIGKYCFTIFGISSRQKQRPPDGEKASERASRRGR